MSAQPEANYLGPEVWLLRRVGEGRVEKKTGRVKAGAFVLRVAQQELALSFYDADHVEPADLLATARSSGWGIVSVQTKAVREIGFTVEREEDAADPRFGKFHVAAKPPEYDTEGQIPMELRVALAAQARVLIAPK